jgi:hypothetical protein
MITRLDPGYSLTDCFYNSRPFMAGDHRHGVLGCTGYQVIVAVAYPGCGHFNQDFTFSRRRQFQRFYSYFLACFV